MHIASKAASIMVAVAACIANSSSAKDQPDADAQTPLAVWQSYKYGMFIHFGMATFTGRSNENDPRNADAPSSLYAPTDLDVDQWIRVARDAGMKYAVLTAKHTAGHCLWDSKVRFRGKEFDYDVATSGHPTDVVAAFVKACKKYGIAPGLYWCPLDFHNNSVPPKPQWNAGQLPDDFYQFAQDQFAELIKCYPDVGYYWIDVPRSASEPQRQALYDLIKRQRPGALVLFNCHASTIESCQKRNGWPTDILNTERAPFKPGEFTPVQTWQGKTYHLGYEHCDCLAQHWFWYKDDQPRPVAELHRLYRGVVDTGGTLLLDVAPDQAGRIPESSVKALMELKKAIDAPQADGP